MLDYDVGLINLFKNGLLNFLKEDYSIASLNSCLCCRKQNPHLSGFYLLSSAQKPTGEQQKCIKGVSSPDGTILLETRGTVLKLHDTLQLVFI